MVGHNGRVDSDRPSMASEAGSGLRSSDAVLNGNGLSLDEAEGIAARRLRELAIRLSDGIAGEAGNKPESDRQEAPPFDADRHFRARLARRIADLSQDTAGKEAGDEAVQPEAQSFSAEPLPYAVSDALDFSAFGERFSNLMHTPRVEFVSLRTDDAAEHFEPSLPYSLDPEPDGATLEPQSGTLMSALDAGATAAPVSLVDLIQEQRTLLDRLSDLSLGQEVDDAGAPGSKSDVNLADLAQSLAPIADAETVAPTVADLALEVSRNAAHPVRLSAEQLIAALEETVPLRNDGPEPALSQLSLKHAPAGPAAHADPSPMIIERARAEFTANGGRASAPQAVPPSGMVGFIAGLSLSMMIGAALYMVLQV